MISYNICRLRRFVSCGNGPTGNNGSWIIYIFIFSAVSLLGRHELPLLCIRRSSNGIGMHSCVILVTSPYSVTKNDSIPLPSST
jgi:hypothetical protein